MLLAMFEELEQQLRSNFPELLPLHFSALDPSLFAELPSYLMSQLPGSRTKNSYAESSAVFTEFDSKRLFVFCKGNEDMTLAYRESNPLASWGVAIACKLAIAWVPNPYLVWHEILHLIDAKDCYNKFGIHKCPASRCIMQLVPSRIHCGERLILCSKNVQRIRRFGAEQIALSETDG